MIKINRCLGKFALVYLPNFKELSQLLESKILKKHFLSYKAQGLKINSYLK